MESLRKGEKVYQKTLMSLGWSQSQAGLKTLKETTQKMVIQLCQERQMALPGMAEIIYGTEPDKNLSTSGQRKRSRKKDIFRPIHSEEKNRIIHGI